jgi:hypothetical protein
MMDDQTMHTQNGQAPIDSEPKQHRWSWRYILTMAGLVVLGITPWASAQNPPPNMPAYCPPLTAIANPTMFDVFWGTTPIRFPYQ